MEQLSKINKQITIVFLFLNSRMKDFQWGKKNPQTLFSCILQSIQSYFGCMNNKFLLSELQLKARISQEQTDNSGQLWGTVILIAQFIYCLELTLAFKPTQASRFHMEMKQACSQSGFPLGTRAYSVGCHRERSSAMSSKTFPVAQMSRLEMSIAWEHGNNNWERWLGTTV